MPKTKEQNEQIKLERYNSIIDACCKLFSFRRFESVTIDDITSFANCSHGLFFHYFKNKEDVVKAMLMKVIDDFADVLEPVNFENGTAKEIIEEFTHILIKGLKSSDDKFCSKLYLLLTFHLKNPELPKPKKNLDLPIRKRPLFAIVKDLIDKGKTENTVINEDSIKLTVAFLSLLEGLSYNRRLVGYKRFICPSEETILRTIMKGDN